MKSFLGNVLIVYLVYFGLSVFVCSLSVCTAADNLSPKLASPEMAVGAVSAGDDSSVFVLQAAGGSGFLLLWSAWLWWYGRRDPVAAARRMIRQIERVDTDNKVQYAVKLEGCGHDLKTPDPAECFINREVRRLKRRNEP